MFPELSGADPVIMDFILLTQTNHTIYDYGSFGFSAAVTAGGSTMVADGYRFAYQKKILKTYLQQEAAPDPCSNQEKVTRGLEQGKCHIDTTATKRAAEGERSEKQCLFHHKMSFEQPTVALDIIALQNLLVTTSRLFLELIIISDYYQ